VPWKAISAGGEGTGTGARVVGAAGTGTDEGTLAGMAAVESEGELAGSGLVASGLGASGLGGGIDGAEGIGPFSPGVGASGMGAAQSGLARPKQLAKAADASRRAIAVAFVRDDEVEGMRVEWVCKRDSVVSRGEAKLNAEIQAGPDQAGPNQVRTVYGGFAKFRYVRTYWATLDVDLVILLETH